VLEDGVEQRLQILARRLHVLARGAGLGVRIEDGELELLFGGIEVDEQVVDLVQHLVRPRVLAVDLVHDEDRGQLLLEGLAQDVPRLRERAFGGVHEEHDAVHHLERALDLAPKSLWPGVSTMLIFVSW
jgi:hypothetical protein